jgi:hypothetical protein
MVVFLYIFVLPENKNPPLPPPRGMQKLLRGREGMNFQGKGDKR